MKVLVVAKKTLVGEEFYNIGDDFRFQLQEFKIKNITDATEEKPIYSDCYFLHLELKAA